jgi:Tol biopolymer transport system component
MTPGSPSPSNDQPDTSERLDGWDQIAFYLHITRATAQRWQSDGLPVHRHVHGKLGRVFAFKSELDAWTGERTLGPPETAVPPSGHVADSPANGSRLSGNGPPDDLANLETDAVPEPPGSGETPGAGETLLAHAKKLHFSPLVVLAGLGISVVLAGVFVWAHHDNSATGIPVVPQPEGMQEHPDLSPDGTQVVMAWDHGDPKQRHIYITPVKGGEARQVTTIKNSDTFPRWSPDGRHILFGRFDWQGQIAFTLIDTSGENEVTLTTSQENAVYLAWAPDGRSFLFTDRIETGQIALFRFDLDSRERTQITAPPAGFMGDLQSEVSPDGKQIAIGRFQSSAESDLYVMPAQGGPARRLTHDVSKIEGFAWADSSIIVYSSRRGGIHYRLWKVRADGTAPDHPAPVAGAEPDAVYPSLSSGALRTRLVYQRRRREYNIFNATTPSNQAPRPALAAAGYNGMPGVSPGGDRIAFVSERSGHPQLYVTGYGGQTIQITNLTGASPGAPSWSPKGDLLAFTADSLGYCGLYRARADGREFSRVIFEERACGAPSWSRDGEWIYFRSARSGSQQIWKVRWDGTDLRQVTFDGGFEGYEASDGASFYFIKEGGPVAVVAPLVPVYRVPSGGGAEFEIPVKVRMTFWTVVDSGILFLRLWERDEYTKLYLLRFATHRIEPAYSIPVRSDRFQKIAASRDGKSIYWGQMTVNRADAMIINHWR